MFYYNAVGDSYVVLLVDHCILSAEERRMIVRKVQ